MKAFLIGIVFFVVVAAAALIGLKYFYTPPTGSQSFQTASTTKTGLLQKSSIAKSDFTHVLISSGQSTGVASYTLNLDAYVGKTVSITGQFSGDTLYGDTITIVP